MGDTIKARKGLKANIDHLLLGEFGFTTDEERVYIGGNNGNIPLPNAADLSDGAKLITTPQKTTANITYYVNTSTGNDSNDGLTSSTAFKTITKAISIIPQVVNHTVVINVAAGTYDEIVTISGFVGKGAISLLGDTVISSSRIVKNISVSSCTCTIMIQGFATNTALAHDVVVSKCSSAILSYMNLITSNLSYSGIYCDYGNLYAHHNTVSNKGIGINSWVDGNILLQITGGSGNNVALAAQYGGVISLDLNTIVGTTQEQIGAGGAINSTQKYCRTAASRDAQTTGTQTILLPFTPKFVQVRASMEATSYFSIGETDGTYHGYSATYSSNGKQTSGSSSVDILLHNGTDYVTGAISFGYNSMTITWGKSGTTVTGTIYMQIIAMC